jgi:hypothetical protein
MRFVAALTFVIFPSVGACAPHVLGVVNSADFATGIPLGGFGTIYGSSLSDGTYQASTYPFPQNLGPTTAWLCNAILPVAVSSCQPISLIFVSQTQINFVMPQSIQKITGLPMDLMQLAVVVSVNGVIDDGTPTTRTTQGLNSGNFANYNPRIFREGYDCFTDSRFQDYGKNCGLSWTQPPTNAADRGAITDLDGNLITSTNPSHLGQFLVAWVSGLGAHGQKVNATGFIANIPFYGYPNYQNTQQISLAYAGESGFPGLFQVNFQVPTFIATGDGTSFEPSWPCGNYSWEISLAVGIANYRQVSNFVQIPVAVKVGDVPCSP